ncbi:MAG: MBL fold metallo-hydrolase, partial [Propionibacterium sp.]
MESVTVSSWETNSYFLGADFGDECVVIDPGITGFKKISAKLQKMNRKPVAVLCTHGHIDHIGDAAILADHYQIPVYIHSEDQHLLTKPADAFPPQYLPMLVELMGGVELSPPNQVRNYSANQSLELAGVTIEPLFAPGHTPGSTLLKCADLVFTGDVLFAGSIGRMDLPGGSEVKMRETIKTVFPKIADEAKLLPGHGPASTMAQEWAT